MEGSPPQFVTTLYGEDADGDPFGAPYTFELLCLATICDKFSLNFNPCEYLLKLLNAFLLLHACLFLISSFFFLLVLYLPYECFYINIFLTGKSNDCILSL